MKTYNLPGGGSTTSIDRCSREWRRLARPIEKALGGRLIGFDPGLLIGYGQRSLSLTTHEAQCLYTAITKKEAP